MKKIIIIEDNQSLVSFIRTYLSNYSNYTLQDFAQGTNALRNIKLNKPDLVILDLSLEDIRGENVCEEIRRLYPDLPVIILTADANKEKMISLLNLGADDYITKPFDIEILFARINAKLRHSQAQNENVALTVADLNLDPGTYNVKRMGKEIELTAKEFELLKFMMLNANVVLNRDKILNAVWGYTSEVDTRVVDVHIGKLRKKIDKPYAKKLIHSLRGFGYKISG